MNFFKNKTNIILVIVLIVLLGAGGFFAYNVLKEPTPKAIDFTNMSESEIIAWANEKGVSDRFDIKHEYDDNIPQGSIIYQSIKEGDEIVDSVLIIVSDGPDLTNATQIPANLKTIDDFNNWAIENEFVDYVIEYNNESEEAEGTILSIDPLIVKNGQKTKVTIASNKNIDVPDFTYMSDKEISSWANENGIKISYIYENSEIPKNNFISQSVKPGDKVGEGDNINIVISKGAQAEETAKTAIIDETKYLGAKEEVFLKDLKALGFINIVKIEDVKSVKYAKGTICYYLPDGKQKLDTKIEYKVSTGNEEPSSNKTATIDPYGYLGKKEETFLSELKKLGFTNIVKIAEIESTKYSEGTICYYLPDGEQKLDTKIEYKVVKKTNSEETVKTAYIHETKFLGKKEADFVNELKALGFTNIVKIGEMNESKYSPGTVCYYLPDGNQKLNTKIEYKIVKAKEVTPVDPPKPVEETVKVPNITSNPCGTSSSCSLNGLKYTIVEASSNIEKGKIISINPASGTEVKKDSTVTITISKGEETKYIDKSEAYRASTATYTTVDATKSYMQESLSGFNLEFVVEKSTNYDTGKIVSISVNGSTTYSPGTYPLSTVVIVTISSGYPQ